MAVFGITAKNQEQKQAIREIMNPKNKLVVIEGLSGTGKNAIALGCIFELMDNSSNERGTRFEKLYYVREVIQVGNNIGYLKGDAEEKLEPYTKPLRQFIEKKYKNLKGENKEKAVSELMKRVEVLPVQFTRGMNIEERTIMLIDEAQNCSVHDVHTLLTRVDRDALVIVIGDIGQIDDPKLNEVNNGLGAIIREFEGESLFAHVQFTENQRGPLSTLADEKFRKYDKKGRLKDE